VTFLSGVDHPTVLPEDNEIANSIMNLLDRSWFERLWILQEIHLAGPAAVIMCGRTTITWKAFRNAIGRIKLTTNGTYPIKIAAPFTAVWKLCKLSNERPTFQDALDASKYLKYTGPRDRIYALAGLIDNGNKLIISDYSKSVERVFQETVLNYIYLYDDLEILNTCSLHPESVSSPTWILNWTAPDGRERRWEVPASVVSCTGGAHCKESGFLEVNGVCVLLLMLFTMAVELLPWIAIPLEHSLPRIS
jgi:hypothetical protein